MTDTNKKAVAAKEAKTDVAAYEGYAEFAGAGFENQSQDDYSIPFITILQALSPQLEEDESLRAGMIINTVTGDVAEAKKGVAFVPATTQHVFVEFKPRESGGGFVGVHATNSDVVVAAKNASSSYGQYNTPTGNELVETFYVYGVLVGEDGSATQAVIGFTSAKIKKYKAWMTKAKTVQINLPDGRRIPAPLFAHRYRLVAVIEKNSKGTFYNWDVKFDGDNAADARLAPTDDLFQAADAIRKMVETGDAKINPDAEKTVGGEGKKDEDDIPF